MSETKAEKFKRCYHSKERVAFVSRLPCCACGYAGFTRDNHHVESDGVGRKGPYMLIVPLCTIEHGRRGKEGNCHHRYHNEGRDTFRERMGIEQTWAELAEETEAKWLEHTERI